MDTNILIDFFRKKRKKKTALYQLNKQYQLTISTISEFEFLSGFSRLHSNLGQDMIKGFEILPFHSDCARKAVEIYRELKAANFTCPAVGYLHCRHGNGSSTVVGDIEYKTFYTYLTAGIIADLDFTPKKTICRARQTRHYFKQ